MDERIYYWQYSGSRNLLKDENKDLFLEKAKARINSCLKVFSWYESKNFLLLVEYESNDLFLEKDGTPNKQTPGRIRMENSF
jgi:hypothetical protein